MANETVITRYQGNPIITASAVPGSEGSDGSFGGDGRLEWGPGEA